MRQYIKNQLLKIQLANLTNFNEETNTYQIPKYAAPTYELNKCYIIKVSNELVNNTTHTIAANWNKNTAPKIAYLKVYVSKMLGSMIYVDSLGFDWENKQDIDGLYWSGWLPIKSLTQLLAI